VAILDAHAHVFPDHIAPGAMKTLVGEAKWMKVIPHHDGTVAGLLACMDAAGIDRAICCSVATRPTQVRKITDWSASIAGPRIIPFASINPDFDDVEAETARIASLGIRGLKFHPQYMQCAADDPRAIRIARAAAAAGLAMEFHAGYDLAFDPDDLAAPARIRRLHESVPSLRLLACHLGGWRCWDQVLSELIGLPIWLETSFCLGQCPPDVLLRILTAHPADYVLFGTDAPWANPTEELAKFRALPLADDIKAAATLTNALRFIYGQAQPTA
jgi:predicted TIM-barrel fold metal-dependent hydrolase